MTREEVRAAARRVTQWHERFAPLFGRKESREHSLVYVKGLLSNQKRKSIEPLALHFARGPQGAAATQNEVAASLPPEAWKPLVLREGSKGPLVHEFAAVRVWAMRHYKAGPPIWLVLRRTTEHTDLKYYVSNASADTPWQNIAVAGGSRWRVEENLEDGKMHMGMADYEARSWSSWHHHMAMVGLAHLYVTLTNREAKHTVPNLTLDLALRVLRSAFARPTLSEDEAIDLIDYYVKRNDVARESHRKSWLARHKQLAKKLLL
jgi:SRSO17 transposase